LLLLTALLGGCSTRQLFTKTVAFSFRNDSPHRLDWVGLEDTHLNPIGGVLRPGIFKTSLGTAWGNEDNATLKFIDEKTRQPYVIALSFAEATKAVKAGTCDHVIVSIRDYDKAVVLCELRPR
jgi:hypothetical protein